MSFVGPMTAKLVDTVITEVTCDENKQKIKEKVIDPLVNDVNKRYAPYFSALVVLLAIIIGLLINICIKL